MTSDDRLLRGGIAWERVLLITTLLAALVFSAAPSAQAQTLFRDASANLPGGTSGPGMDVAAADVDGDGDLDIVIPNEFAANLLILNNGEAVFTQPTARFNSQANDSEDVEVVDLDNDGDLEVVFVAEDNARHELYAGNGNGTFRDVSSLLPMSIANAVAVADLDGDSFLDLVIGNAGQDLILMNRGSGNLNATPLQRSFQNETAQRLPPETRTTQDVELVDVDRDGDLDIMCGNEDGNQLLINDGTGKFTDQTAQRLPVVATMETRKVTFADVDGDGDPDLFLSNVAFIPGKNPQNRLYLNNGNGAFTDVTGTSLPSNSTWALDGKFIDADRDGDLDLITAGFNGPARFLRNDGSGRFTDATAQVLPPLPSGANIGIEIADLNRDGFLDVYVVRRGQADLLLLAETPSAQALNLSTRGRVQTGEKVLIGGFIFTGSAPKRVLLRGIGPSLENAGVSGVLLDPELQLRAADGSLLASNDNWRDTQEDQIAATGLSPDHSAESAVLATLTSGAYTAILSGKGGAQGIGLVEIYDLDRDKGQLRNISTRGAVASGDNVMIAGFILGHGSGAANVLIRAMGPSLRAAGIEDAAEDPSLELYNANGVRLAMNDNWRSDQEQGIAATGLQPQDDRESAILHTALPGNYTAILRDGTQAAGVALAEVYILK